MSKLIHLELSNKLLAAAFTVHSILGLGLLESCYEGAMVVELEKVGIPCQRQQVFLLRYKGAMVGDYIADLAGRRLRLLLAHASRVVDNTVILELKSVKAFNAVMSAQIVSYLKISAGR